MRTTIFLLDVKTEDEARVLMETLPLAKAQVMDSEYIPVGPLVQGFFNRRACYRQLATGVCDWG